MKNLYFKINKLNSLTFINYKNKFNLENILKILKLSLNICNNLENVLELFDKCYKNSKMKLDFGNNILNLIIKYPLLFQERESSIKLIKEELDIKKRNNVK